MKMRTKVKAKQSTEQNRWLKEILAKNVLFTEVFNHLFMLTLFLFYKIPYTWLLSLYKIF